MANCIPITRYAICECTLKANCNRREKPHYHDYKLDGKIAEPAF